MEALFLRHAHAGNGFGEDDHRWLSPRGRVEAIEIGGAIASSGWSPTRVWTSPKVRATQTCELVLRAFADLGNADEVVQVWADLAYGTTASALSCLDRMGDQERVLVVGHEPLIRSMAGQAAQEHLSAFATATGALVDVSAQKLIRHVRG